MVHENMLEDLVFPTEIVGKRIRFKVDGSKLIKVYVVHDGVWYIHILIFFLFISFLDSKDKNNLEYKVDTFSAVYKKMTGKDVVFEFPAVVAEQAQ